MIRARVLWVLAQIARREDGDLRAARVESYARIDPLVRGLVRSRAQQAVARASFETERGDDERHVHRLAFLREAGELGGLPDDVEAIREAFEERAPREAPSARGVTYAALAALLVALTLGGGLTFWLTRDPAPLRDELPPSRGAWVEGGRPDPGSEEVRGVFERGIPRFVEALDHLRAVRDTPEQPEALAELERREARLIADGEGALGPDTTSFLRALLDQSKQMIAEDGSAAEDSHLRSVEAFNAAIAGQGLGYYLDAMVRTEVGTGRHRVYASTFTVERVRLYDAGGLRVRALRLQRLDHLNFARRLLGFTRPQVSDALVLLDRVEGHLVGTVLPGLATDARMPLTDPESRGAPWAERVETLAARDAREEIRARLGDRGARLGDLFARRERLLEGWERRLGPSGIRIARPRTFDFDLRGFVILEERVPREEWRELEAIARETREDAIREAYREFEEAFVASVERHEVQHRLDYAQGTLEAMPEPLGRLVGELEVGGHENRLARRSLAELSAYLSELARGPDIVETNLALFAQHLLDRRGWGSPESYAAIIVFEGIARHLGIGHSPLLSGSVDRAAVADLFVAMREREARQISDAARALWRELFGRPLPELHAEA